jgi:hypothetical protein
VLSVQEWAEIRAMRTVQGLSIKEIARRTGHSRNTIRAALRSPEPLRYGPRPKRSSNLDPFLPTICELLDDEPTLSGVRIREEIEKLGYGGGKTILDDRLRELRPRFLPPPRSFQRTVYRPGELAQFDLCEPRAEIPVGWDQTRKGYLVTCKLPYSRAFAGALVFSKEWEDIAWGMNRCLSTLGALPNKLVWDREGAIHAGGGRPSEAFAAWCGRLALGWIILDPGDAEAKGALERDHRFVHGNFEAGRLFANPLDFQASSTPGARGSTAASTEPPGRSSRSASPPSASGCAGCRQSCPTPIAASSSVSRRSPTCASTETTTRSTRASSAGGSRFGRPKRRSPRSRSTAASSAPAIAASSRAASPPRRSRPLS